jgi:hypothetical protein
VWCAMLEREIMGHTIIECSAEEARQLWKDDPENRHRIWTHDEVTAHMLSDPATLAAVIEQKRLKPGSCLPVGYKNKAHVRLSDSPAYCKSGECLCSEVGSCEGVCL